MSLYADKIKPKPAYLRIYDVILHIIIVNTVMYDVNSNDTLPKMTAHSLNYTFHHLETSPVKLTTNASYLHASTIYTQQFPDLMNPNPISDD